MNRFGLLLVLILLAPTSPGAEVSVSDAAGDHALVVAGISTASPGQAMGVDILEATLQEQPEGVQFSLNVAEGTVEANDAFIQFSRGQQEYILDFLPGDNIDGVGLYLVREGTPSLVASLDGSMDGTFVPNSLLLDIFGAPLEYGESISNWTGHTRTFHTSISGGDDLYAEDRVPDTGFGIELISDLGAPPTFPIEMHTTKPSRASNGERTSFVYDLNLRNQGEEGVFVANAKAPEGWDVAFSPNSFILGEGEQSQMFAIVSTPSKHQHGAVEPIHIELRSSDGTLASKETVYVHFHTIPQPSGHHDILYLHAKEGAANPLGSVLGAANTLVPYINTIENDPEETQSPVPGYSGGFVASSYSWEYRLKPALNTGLVMEQQNGKFSLSLETPTPILAGSLSGELRIEGANEQILGTMVPIDQISTENGELIHLETMFTPTEGIETIHFEVGQALVLDLELAAGRPASNTVAEAPLIHPGSHLELALLEYRESLPEIAQTSFGIEGESQRKKNPGDAAWIELRNPENVPITIEGVNDDWVSLHDPRSVSVHIPADAVAGDLLDVLLLAEKDGQQQGVARLIILVDETEEWPSDFVPSNVVEQETPWPSLLAPLAILALAVLRRK